MALPRLSAYRLPDQPNASLSYTLLASPLPTFPCLGGKQTNLPLKLKIRYTTYSEYVFLCVFLSYKGLNSLFNVGVVFHDNNIKKMMILPVYRCIQLEEESSGHSAACKVANKVECCILKSRLPVPPSASMCGWTS